MPLLNSRDKKEVYVFESIRENNDEIKINSIDPKYRVYNKCMLANHSNTNYLDFDLGNYTAYASKYRIKGCVNYRSMREWEILGKLHEEDEWKKIDYRNDMKTSNNTYAFDLEIKCKWPNGPFRFFRFNLLRDTANKPNEMLIRLSVFDIIEPQSHFKKITCNRRANRGMSFLFIITLEILSIFSV